MANLITVKQKKIIKHEYYIRLISAGIFLISILGLFILAYVLPYYIYVKHSYLATIEQFENTILAENTENTGESMSRLVKKTLEEIKAVELYFKNTLSPTDYLKIIIENKNSAIKINKISFNLNKNNTGQFFITGISQNREGLVNFIEDLNITKSFTSVESPVSDFAKDRDINFTLSINI